MQKVGGTMEDNFKILQKQIQSAIDLMFVSHAKFIC